jgi:hypothetical protein
MKESLIETTEKWEPNPEDKDGRVKQRFLKYMLKYCRGRNQAQSIKKIISTLHLDQEMTKEAFQMRIIVPLREDRNVFIGTSHKGIYLIEDADDAHTTMTFYQSRIRSEHKHLKNLRALAKRHELFKNYPITGSQSGKTHIFIDESGTPTVTDQAVQPFYIVSGIIVEEKKPLYRLTQKFKHLKEDLHKSEDYEFKSTDLSDKEYEYTLKELSTIDYEFATICFIKERLTTRGFEFPKSFYKYAHQFLLDEILEYVGNAKLYFDEYGGIESSFKEELFKYLREQNTGFPIDKIEQMEMFRSELVPFIQFADLIAGVIKKKMKNSLDLLHLIEDRALCIREFPY